MQGGFLPEWFGAAIALAALFTASYLQLRHLALALVAVLAPLPGGLLAAWLHAEGLAPSYLFGFFITCVLASQVAAKVCDGEAAKEAVKDVTRSTLPILVWPAVLGICISVMHPVLSHRLPGLTTTAATVLSCAAALTLLPAARFLPYDSGFVIRANRARETRERWLDRLTFVVQPRWGWSVSGIALIFSVLGFFGGVNSGAADLFAEPVVLSAWGVLFAAFAYAATRNIRRAIAFLLSKAVLVCVMFWISGHIAVAAPSSTVAAASMPALFLAAQSSAFMRAGDSVAVATLRSFEQFAVPILFYSLAALLALCALGAFDVATLMACGGIVALVVFPALMTAIYDLFPPRISLDAYRVR